VVSEAAQGGVSPYGESGMKMNGPYDWIPPNYWYGSQVGAAFGFDSETSAGPSIPEIDTLNSMLSTSDEKTLWSNFTAAQYHAGAQSGQFGVLKLYDNALAGRYGKPTSLSDYVEKAQLANYENARAEFESRLARMDRSSNPATGVIFWMMNNGWPSLIWHLFGYDLAPNGSTYGTLKANQPVHVLWQYDSNAVTLDNISTSAASGLSVTAQTYALDGTLKTSQTANNLSVAANHTTSVFTLKSPSGVSGAYLIKLTVKDSSGKEINRNVYWWSTKTDKIDWSNSDWYYTPTTQYADLSELTSMAKTPVSATASSTINGGNETTTVKLVNTGSGKAPAFFVEAKLRDSSGNQIAPVYWSDNDVTLWPGESITLTVNYAAVSGTPQIQVSGVNVASNTVTASTH
jgi:exo-1,4-beta-D-glucosaminidase